MVQQLSEFLRITLRRADEHWISLDEEWHYLQLYLEIEKVRFGHRLDVVTDFEEGTRSWKIPTLLLQPLVENAIKFGLYGTTGKVTITIEGRVQESLLGIRVTNPFDPDTQASRGNGFGLNGLKRRLYLLFARNDLLQTEVTNNIFTVTLKIPRKI
jgi:LytS/YehU family sensor histidine kinase